MFQRWHAGRWSGELPTAATVGMRASLDGVEASVTAGETALREEYDSEYADALQRTGWDETWQLGPSPSMPWTFATEARGFLVLGDVHDPSLTEAVLHVYAPLSSGAIMLSTRRSFGNGRHTHASEGATTNRTPAAGESAKSLDALRLQSADVLSRWIRRLRAPAHERALKQIGGAEQEGAAHQAGPLPHGPDAFALLTLRLVDAPVSPRERLQLSASLPSVFKRLTIRTAWSTQGAPTLLQRAGVFVNDALVLAVAEGITVHRPRERVRHVGGLAGDEVVLVYEQHGAAARMECKWQQHPKQQLKQHPNQHPKEGQLQSVVEMDIDPAHARQGLAMWDHLLDSLRWHASTGERRQP